MIKIVPLWTKPAPAGIVVNTTSSARGCWSQGLSPFLLGPVDLYDGLVSRKVENGWQYSKVYADFLDGNGDVAPSYWTWAKQGWDAWRAERYPMGKGSKPEFALWQGERLGYIESRKRIFMKLYASTVAKSAAFDTLQQKYQEALNTGQDLILLDFDAYDHVGMGMSYDDVMNNPAKTMGHAFILAMLLEGHITP